MFIEENYYHIFNKSIAGFVIFRDKPDYQRMLNSLRYYQYSCSNAHISLSVFLDRPDVRQHGFSYCFPMRSKDQCPRVKIIAYCLMPTHFHLILKQVIDGGISKFMSDTLNSYTRYFNLRYNRKGPLWVGRFKSVDIEDDDQFLHLTRYIHLNPTTDRLVEKPGDWPYSSYKEYLTNENCRHQICELDDCVRITPADYRTFVEERIQDQQNLAILKRFKLL